jgi:hypothetical protein
MYQTFFIFHSNGWPHRGGSMDLGPGLLETSKSTSCAPRARRLRPARRRKSSRKAEQPSAPVHAQVGALGKPLSQCQPGASLKGLCFFALFWLAALFYCETQFSVCYHLLA